MQTFNLAQLIMGSSPPQGVALTSHGDVRVQSANEEFAALLDQSLFRQTATPAEPDALTNVEEEPAGRIGEDLLAELSTPPAQLAPVAVNRTETISAAEAPEILEQPRARALPLARPSASHAPASPIVEMPERPAHPLQPAATRIEIASPEALFETLPAPGGRTTSEPTPTLTTATPDVQPPSTSTFETRHSIVDNKVTVGQSGEQGLSREPVNLVTAQPLPPTPGHGSSQQRPSLPTQDAAAERVEVPRASAPIQMPAAEPVRGEPAVLESAPEFHATIVRSPKVAALTREGMGEQGRQEPEAAAESMGETRPRTQRRQHSARPVQITPARASHVETTAATEPNVAADESVAAPVPAQPDTPAEAPFQATTTHEGLSAFGNNVQASPAAGDARARVANGRREIVPTVQREVVDILNGPRLERGEHRAKIHIHPPELGSVSITLKVKDNRVSMEFTVENRDVKMMLDSSETNLKSVLNERGLTLEQFDVGLSDSNRADGSLSEQAKRADGEWRGDDDAVAEAAAEGWFRSPEVLTNSRVNVFA